MNSIDNDISAKKIRLMR